MNNPQFSFVFVVCGSNEHIQTLHESLPYLKRATNYPIIVVTDTLRNEIPILHSKIIDIKTPENYNHHQASIWLKTSLHKHLPIGPLYCHLDSDIIAVNPLCNQIFKEFKEPILFAHDHIKTHEFSPYAINCNCLENHQQDKYQFDQLLNEKLNLPNYPGNIENNDIKKLFSFLSKKHNPLKLILFSIKFILSIFVKTVRIEKNIKIDFKNKQWRINNTTYPILLLQLKSIRKKTGYRYSFLKRHWLKPDKNPFSKNECNHLIEAIQENFDVKITNPNWNHWNGGVFLFNEKSHPFLTLWHNFTIEIFENSRWKTRDQGTLIATVWKMGLQNHPVLPKEFNFIADFYKLDYSYSLKNNQLIVKENKKTFFPKFIHVYHQYGNTQWDLWQLITTIPKKETILPENLIINGLWVEGELGPLENMTILSAMEMGHDYHLWTYNQNIIAPIGTVIKNAEEIIPYKEVFKKNNADPSNGIGKNSYGAPFSNIFRYKLLMLKGGWWVDMDVTFLQTLNTHLPYFFRSHPYLNAIGNVIKVPINCELMIKTYTETYNSCNSNTIDWLLPNKILNKNIECYNLQSYINKNISNQDIWYDTKKLFFKNNPINSNWLIIHWMNEEWKRYKLKKNQYINHSFFESILKKYYQQAEKISFIRKIYLIFNQSYVMEVSRKIKRMMSR